MYSMKEVCDLTGMKYETLKYYCNEGLVSNIKRNENNYRVFDDRDVAWINSLSETMRHGNRGNERIRRLVLQRRAFHSRTQTDFG